MRKKERILYAIIALIFILALVEARNMPDKISTYPRLICWLGSALSLVLIVQSFMQEYREKRVGRLDAAEEENLTSAQKRRVVVSLGIVLAYIAGIGFIGYVTSTLVFMIVLMAFLKRNMRPLYIIVSCLFVASIYFSFTVFLNIPLPKGIFF